MRSRLRKRSVACSEGKRSLVDHTPLIHEHLSPEFSYAARFVAGLRSSRPLGLPVFGTHGGQDPSIAWQQMKQEDRQI